MSFMINHGLFSFLFVINFITEDSPYFFNVMTGILAKAKKKKKTQTRMKRAKRITPYSIFPFKICYKTAFSLKNFDSVYSIFQLTDVHT